ncbi:Crp/Fnr family transcriptional regulator [Mesorhizobium abyssinicae]|uniref:Crp/Fnr family transcriptional regulator n=1 Tax=Mesorhizobium abyssinicae TaxID=1209958 RepID=A0ABU5ANU9_9HYPH|nr:Crp/Fnr family transcriptional regulator [Mesorhizobium abyssinicae]MDX8538977.1 Crp/Fnr family transcriptional regulator [Mesorhizobium abyssinicae]
MSAGRQDVHNSNVPALCQSCEARHNGMCGVLNADELLAFAKHTRVVRHGAGEELLSEGASITAYSNVMRGVVKLIKTLADGRRQIVGLQFAPDFVGRLYADESAVTAEAASDVELCRISKRALERMVASNPMLEGRLLKQALRDVDEAREWMVALGRKTASEKLASFLGQIGRYLDPMVAQDDRTLAFELPLTRAEIADFLGLTIGTVSRELSRLKRDGIIEIRSRRKIEIIDRQRLQQRSG